MDPLDRTLEQVWFSRPVFWIGENERRFAVILAAFVLFPVKSLTNLMFSMYMYY